MTTRYDPKRYPQLVDAKVRVRGTTGPVFNQRHQLIGVNMYTQSLDEVSVLEPAPADPFVLPRKAVRNVFEYVPGAGPDHRVRIHGVVTANWQGKAFFITDGSQGAGVLSGQTTSVKPGDIVDVIGFPALGDYTPTIHDAAYRKVGSGPAPEPRSITAKEALSGDFDGDFVRIDARLIQQERATDQYTLTLESGGSVFSAVVPTDQSDGLLDGLRDGSGLRLSGICTITETQASRHFRVPKAFQILLRSTRDAVVLERPSWWTAGRILVLLGVCILTILAGALWVLSLQTRVQERTETIRATLEATADAILVVDSAGKIITHNQKFDIMWAVQEPILKPLGYHHLLDLVKSQLIDPETFIGSVSAVDAEAVAQTDDLIEFKDGRVFECHSEPQTVNGKNVGRVWGFRDVTAVRQRDRELQELARVDTLTGIRNRRAIFEFLASELARSQRHGGPLVVMMADLDWFKKINDRYGHAAGDMVLKETANRVKSSMRVTDAIGRYGGEEFLIVLPSCDESSAWARAEEFRRIIENRPVSVESREIEITCSIGVTCTRDGGTGMDQLLEAADAALYRAKQAGRNRVVLAEAEQIRSMGGIQCPVEMARN